MNKKPALQSALNLGYSNTPPKLDGVTLAWECATPSCSTEKSSTKSFAPRNYPHTPEQIAEEIRVDEEGNLWWKKRKKGRKFYDKPLGTVNRTGYLVFGLDYHVYFNHTICFCLYHGSWPRDKMDIDHKDGVKTNNKKENLHEATRSQNRLNPNNIIQINNTSGYKNIQYIKQCKLWQVGFTQNGIKTIDFFKTLKEAIIWRDNVVNSPDIKL